MTTAQVDELSIARAIAAGDLTSPQRYANVWLFALRITGTGAAWRAGRTELAFRNPEHYLTDEFLARCNGLPVIWEHPKASVLDSQEFADRSIGTIVLPYISREEVWGIAKVYDDAAAQLMQERVLSTSPSVVLRPSANTAVAGSDGKTVLIEGKPALLDHLAICERGVWDKGEAPSGVRNDSTGATTMTDEEMKAAEAKKKADAEAEEKRKADADADGDAATKLDKVLEGLGGVVKSVDTMGKQITDVCARVDALEGGDAKRTAEVASAKVKDKEGADLAEAQAKADHASMAHGKRAPRALDGETLHSYRLRLLSEHKRFSNAWKDVALGGLPQDTLGIAEAAIYADSLEASMRGDGVPEGQLREIVNIDATGRRISTFVGNTTFIHLMKRPAQRVVKFNTGRRDD